MTSTDAGELVARLREAARYWPEWPSGQLYQEAAAALTAQEGEIKRLNTLVRDAFNEGFNEGMREHTSSRGGNDWRLSRARATLADTAGRAK